MFPISAAALAPVLLAAALPLAAQPAAAPAPSPGEIVAAAPAGDWTAIAGEDLLVMTLAPDAAGKPRRVVIQLMPAPFAQGWIDNIRTLARARWYDGIAVVRVQDNYVVRWGDPNHDNPEASGAARPLPEGLRVMGEGDYTASAKVGLISDPIIHGYEARPAIVAREGERPAPFVPARADKAAGGPISRRDAYADATGFYRGWPVAGERPASMDGDRFGVMFPHLLKTAWPVHCYGMVGVGRNLAPDTGTGAELYTVIGHAPRHLDRNIALVGRVVEGVEHLSSLPRGTGDLGFYRTAQERTPILSIRVASDLPAAEQPRFEYLSTDSASFARYTEARANRRDAFFNVPAGGADICNIPVPVRRAAGQ